MTDSAEQLSIEMRRLLQHEGDIALDAVKAGLHTHSCEEGALTHIGYIADVLPVDSWSGEAGSAAGAQSEPAFNEQEWKQLEGIVGESFVPVSIATFLRSRGCMDPRLRLGYNSNSREDFLSFRGPKSPGGDIIDAVNLAFASRACPDVLTLSIKGALEVIKDIDERNGFRPGSHEVEQCGAATFIQMGIGFIALKPKQARAAAQALSQPCEQNFSDVVQKDIEKTAQEVGSEPGFVPSIATLSIMLAAVNEHGQPHLQGKHIEQGLVLVKKPGYTLHTDEVSVRTTDEMGRRAEMFDDDIWYQAVIADELGDRLGSYFLQTAANVKPPIIGRIVDKNLRVYEYK